MSTRIPTGIQGLDQIISGGFPSNTVTLLSGNPGTGKTLAALSYVMDGTKKKENCYYLSFTEKENELVRACKGIDSLKDVDKYLGKNLQFDYLRLGEKITLKGFLELLERYSEIDRVVIDSVNKFLISAENIKEYRIQFASIVALLKEKSKSSLLVCETSNGIFDTGNGEAYECDGVINISFLDLEEKPTRTLEIAKMRYTDFEPLVKHNLIINSKGLGLSKKKII